MKALRKALLVTLALVVMVAAAACGGRPAGTGMPEKLVVGFVPSVDAAHISDKVEPMRVFLEQELAIPVTVYVGTSYVGVIEGMGAGTVDVGFLNTLGYVLANSEHDVRVVLKTLRQGSATYNAQIIVRDDSGIRTLADLQGKKMAWGSPTSTSGYLYPANYLMQQMNLKTKEDVEAFFSASQFLGSHDNVVKAVYNGDFDAGATFDDARTRVEKELPDVMDKVRVLAVIEGIPNDTVSVRRDLSAEAVQELRAALLKFAETETGKQVLYDLYQIDGLVDGHHDDYAPIVKVATAMGIDIKAAVTGKN